MIKVEKAALEKKTVDQLKTEAIRQGLALKQSMLKRELVSFIKQSSLHEEKDEDEEEGGEGEGGGG